MFFPSRKGKKKCFKAKVLRDGKCGKGPVLMLEVVEVRMVLNGWGIPF